MCTSNFHFISLQTTAMAANLCEEAKPRFTGSMDGNGNMPLNCSCFQLMEPRFDQGDEHCSLDVFPILIEETSFPMREKCPLNSSNSKDVYNISVLPDEDNTSQQCASQLAFLSLLEVPFTSKSHMCLDAQLNCHNCFDLQMEEADPFPPCIVNINLEKETSETMKCSDEPVGSIKTEGVITHMQKVLQRQASSNIDKSFTERVHDAPTNRWRRYKRAASFDSRKIVLLFSILSSLGTLILIYLTLRVRQNGDGFNHV